MARRVIDSEVESGAPLDEPMAEGERRAPLARSPKRIADAVKPALGGAVAPVVVVADPQVALRFFCDTVMAQTLEDFAAFNPFSARDCELPEKALAVTRPILSAELATVLDKVNARLGPGNPTVAIGLEEILMSAQAGRIDVLVVSEGERIWGHFSPNAALTAHGTHMAPTGRMTRICSLRRW